VQYVNFGASGLKVSRLALGLGFRGQPDEGEAQRVVESALDSGINLIDCANVYGPMDDRANIGRSEVVLGKALKGRRDNVVITSKVASEIGPGPNDVGLSRYHIMREVERSLTRLQVDRIDVYLVHRYDDETPLEETLRTLSNLIDSGKIRYYGVCNFAAWQITKAQGIAERDGLQQPIIAQNPYSLMNRDLETEIFPMARDSGIGVMAYSPLAVGLLSGIYSPDDAPPEGSLWATKRESEFGSSLEGSRGEVLGSVREIARDHGSTPAQVALAWVLSHDEITIAITGGDTIEHLNDNIGGAELVLDDSEITLLNKVSASLADVLD
jgi:aryl-alcohol dehydrogenase-like predicted oxidoreductase